MIVFRRRLLFWLIKAYLKKSGKTILFSFIFGLVIFFVFIFISRYFNHIIPVYNKQVIGMVGAYTDTDLPDNILSQISTGLTQVNTRGDILPGLASSWKIEKNGKEYIFYLKPHQYFSDGKEVDANTVSYNFSDVTKQEISKYVVEFDLPESFSPFLTTVSQPVLENGFNGVGSYRVSSISVNGDFIQSLTLVSVHNRLDSIVYQFYPTEDTLKQAFLLGEVTQMQNILSPTYNNLQFSSFPRTTVAKTTDYTSLVTLFYNNSDQYMSDQHLRLALSSTIPNTFTTGVRAFGPYAPSSSYYDKDLESNTQDLEQAKLLLAESSVASSKSKHLPVLTITTLPKYKPIAQIIASSWAVLGFQVKIITTDSIPNQYQIFLGDFSVPKDPDQYVLWHTGQADNITQYNSIRINKLLEEGRSTTDTSQRESIYFDFQKYLMADQPATFLYFPYIYTVTRQ